MTFLIWMQWQCYLYINIVKEEMCMFGLPQSLSYTQTHRHNITVHIDTTDFFFVCVCLIWLRIPLVALIKQMPQTPQYNRKSI